MDKNKITYFGLIIAFFIISTTNPNYLKKKPQNNLNKTTQNIFTISKNKIINFTKKYPFFSATLLAILITSCISKKMRKVLKVLPKDIMDNFKEKPIPMAALSVLFLSYLFANL